MGRGGGPESHGTLRGTQAEGVGAPADVLQARPEPPSEARGIARGTATGPRRHPSPSGRPRRARPGRPGLGKLPGVGGPPPLAGGYPSHPTDAAVKSTARASSGAAPAIPRASPLRPPRRPRGEPCTRQEGKRRHSRPEGGLHKPSVTLMNTPYTEEHFGRPARHGGGGRLRNLQETGVDPGWPRSKNPAASG